MKRLALIAVFVASVALTAQEAPKSTLIDSAQLLLDLKTLSADDMQGRQINTAGGEKARGYVVERFKASGIAAFGSSYEAPFTFAGGGGAERRGVNVIGHIAGSAQFPRYIVVSAHYDHIGVRSGQVFNGADDNASGTAALFAIAKYFAAHKPKNTIVFAAWDGEEVGLRGARAFVAKPPVAASLLALNLNADMIGREASDRLYVVGGALQPFLKPHIQAIAAKAPVKLIMGYENPGDRENWTQQSDHYAFIEAKIPALYFGVEDFEHHHKATDDYETMTYGFYVRAVETLLQAVQYFDQHLDAVDAARRDGNRHSPISGLPIPRLPVAQELLEKGVHLPEPVEPAVVSQRVVHIVGLDDQLVVDVVLT